NPAGPQYSDFAAFLKARPEGSPFCYWFGSHDPHRPYPWETGVKSGMRLEDVRVPPYLPDTEIVRKDMCDYFLEVQRFNRDTQALLDTLEKMGELENTLVVISGDNGWPFPRGKASIYEAGTHVPLAIQWGSRIKGGRKVEDFVSMPDLAPTFLEAAGLKPHADMTARTLMPLLESSKSGRVDSRRGQVLTGMERHVPCREEINGGYPMRALRNHDFHYIRNFLPTRWPYGDPDELETATYEQLAGNTRVAFADCDAGPSKAYMVTHRADAAVRPLYELTFGKRPAQELFDLKKDPWQLKNVAADPAYAGALKKLDGQLMAALKETKDPRATGGGEEFDRYPTMTAVSRGGEKKARKKR
ncbi:MAG: sulfatase-like hydrolase/transferase, partial [Bryobacteraceae bacterium]